MHLASAYLPLLFVLAAATTHEAASAGTPTADPAGFRGVAYFEPPRSIGTPLDELARNYTGYALADRIAGRIRLDTDASLRPTTRELIRKRLAQGI
jgi:hypothetical protein